MDPEFLIQDSQYPSFGHRKDYPLDSGWLRERQEISTNRIQSRQILITENPAPGVPEPQLTSKNAMTESSDKIMNKHIRVRSRQWEMIVQAAKGTTLTANQLVIELAIEALERRRIFSPEAEIRVARSSLFTAQAIARDLTTAGKDKDVQEIRDFISTIVPEPETD